MVFPLFFTHCKKSSDSSEREHYTFDTSKLNLFKLREGAYFIYRDSETLHMDSVTVQDSRVYLTRDYLTDNGYVEKYQLQMHSTAFDNGWYQGAALAQANENFELIAEEFPPSSVWYPFTDLSPLKTYTNIPSMQVNGITYNNVHAYTVKNSWPLNDPRYVECIIYWVERVGIVKRRLIRIATWITTDELIRYG